jgi:hypothetical protein
MALVGRFARIRVIAALVLFFLAVLVIGYRQIFG